MLRREILKLPGYAYLSALSSSFAMAQTTDQAIANYPLTDEVRQEFERLLAAQEATADVLGIRELPRAPEGPLDRLLMWSLIAHDASALDHVPTSPDIPEVPQRFGYQLGPHRSSRAMAIVHVAMFEALNAPIGKYTSFVKLQVPSSQTSGQAAAAWAAHDALIALYPYQQQRISSLLSDDLIRIPELNDPVLAKASKDLGRAAAAAIIGMRANDGSAHTEPQVGKDFVLKGTPGAWDIDPVSRLTVALGAKWGAVTPFVVSAADQFLPPPPPDLASDAYASAYNEVQRVGGDGVTTPTERMDFEAFEGIFWAYDGTPGLCAPPRLYNKVCQDVALQKGISDVVEMSRLLAIANVAMADAAISAWHAKYHYEFWRPVSAIRSDSDNNPLTTADPTYTPLGAPATNGRGPNFTPPFPSYPSGHAVFGGAVFQVLRRLVPANGDQSFTFVSDEFNGRNRGISDTAPRPRLPQSFVSYAHPEYLNARSRLFLGIHFRFDATSGIEMGNKIGNYVVDNLYV